MTVSTAPVRERVPAAPQSPVEAAPSRPRRFDPLVPAVGVVATVTYVLHGFHGLLARDLAVYGYAGQQVVDGVPPYVAIMNRAGPLAHLLPSLGVGLARLFGFDDVLGMRLVFLVFAVASVCLVYLLGRRVFSSRLAGLAAAVAFLSFNGFINYASDGPREKTVMVFLVLCTMLAVIGRRWFVAGIVISVATLTWQPVFFVGMAAVAAGVFAGPRSGRLRAAAVVAVGGLIPSAICVAYFVSVGAFHDFLDGFLLANAQYTDSSHLFHDFLEKWSLTQRVFGVSVVVVVVGLAAMLALFVAALRPGRRRDPARVPVLVVGAALLGGLLWSLDDFDGWPDTFVLLPMAAIGIGGLAKTVIVRLRWRTAKRVALGWAAAMIVLALVQSVVGRTDYLDRQRESIDTVLGQLPSDASMISIGAPEPLVLTRRTNPIQYQMFVSGMDRYVDANWPGGLAGLSAWIDRVRPTVIALGSSEPPDWLRATMTRDYRRVGAAPNWIWYVDRSVGPRVIADLRAELPDDALLSGEYWSA